VITYYDYTTYEYTGTVHTLLNTANKYNIALLYLVGNMSKQGHCTNVRKNHTLMGYIWVHKTLKMISRGKVLVLMNMIIDMTLTSKQIIIQTPVHMSQSDYM